MAFPLPNYIKIKNKYCLAYFGHCNDYVVELLLLRPSIEVALPGIEIHLCCRDRAFHLLQGQKNVIPESQIGEMKWEFAQVKEITCDLSKGHPIESLLTESDIPVLPIITQSQNSSRVCIVLTEARLPTKSLSDSQIKKVCEHVMNKGFVPRLDNSNWEEAGWVIGVEHEVLFLAGSKGIRTTLIETGTGQGIYKSLLPHGEILPAKIFDKV